MPLEKVDDEDEQKIDKDKHHPQELCEMCQKLGRYCGRRSRYSKDSDGDDSDYYDDSDDDSDDDSGDYYDD